LITPTEDQLEILHSTARFNVISGNAGSAKTTTLALKIVDALRQGRRPQDVLVLTYSEAAVVALRQRLRWLGLTREQVLKVPATTFAALCHERIAPFEGESRHLTQPNRLVHDTLLAAVADAREHAARKGHLAAFEIDGEGVLAFPTLLHAMRLMKGTLVLRALGNEFVLTPNSAHEAGLDYSQAAILLAYEQQRRGHPGTLEASMDNGEALFRLDDDPFHDMATLLEADDPVYTDATHPLKLGVRTLFVDEGHDLNAAMFTVLQHLVGVNPIEQMFVVGDVDQVVHSDSGAAPNFMTDTLAFGPSSQSFRLPLCRRFGERLATALGTHAGKPYGFLDTNDTAISIFKTASTQAIAGLIVGAHRKASTANPDRVASIAVLLRDPGASVQLENRLALEGFAVETNGFVPYMQRPEIHFLRVLVAWAGDALDTLAQADLPALQAALGELTGFSGDDLSHGVQHQVIETFTRNVFGLSPLDFVEATEARVQPRPLLYLSDDTALKAIRRFLRGFLVGITPAALPRLVEDAGFRSLAKRAFVFEERVDEAMSAMREFARSAAEFTGLRSWLQQMANREYEARRQRREERPVLRLYTISAAKGLEFDHVVIPGVDGGVFDGAGQEERNLFYVAASRARKELTMTYRDRPSSYLQPFQDSARWDELHAASPALQSLRRRRASPASRVMPTSSDATEAGSGTAPTALNALTEAVDAPKMLSTEPDSKLKVSPLDSAIVTLPPCATKPATPSCDSCVSTPLTA